MKADLNKLDALRQIGFSNSDIYNIVEPYFEKHRFYHNIEHIYNLLDKLESGLFKEVGILRTKPTDKEILYLKIAIIFHDVNYEIGAPNSENEEKSVEYFKLWMTKLNNKLINVEGRDNIVCELLKVVPDLIMITAKRSLNKNQSDLEYAMWSLDNSVLYSTNVKELVDYENRISFEYQKANYKQYLTGRCLFLDKESEKNQLLFYLSSYVKSRKLIIGVYPGSFNPFHIGHKNILDKASKLFDRVIILQSRNSDKAVPDKLDDKLFYQKVMYSEGLLVNDLKKIKEEYNTDDVFVIRGLRNGMDLDFEKNQFHFNKLLSKSDVFENIYITCDKEFEEVSSSAIRMLLKLPDPAPELANKLIYK